MLKYPTLKNNVKVFYHEFKNLRIHTLMKRILKNYRRKRRETYTNELGNGLPFHLKFP